MQEATEAVAQLKLRHSDLIEFLCLQVSVANTGRGCLVRRESRVSGWALTQDAVSVFFLPAAGWRAQRADDKR